MSHNYSRILPRLVLGIAGILTATSAFAVTQDEMEQARTYAAQAYLRFANNGSGYLDEISAKTLPELEKKLKAKEIENLKTFKAIQTPTDYASWDKQKLLEYWGTTFFQSPGLDPEGIKGRTRARKKIDGMKVTPPSATPSPSEQTEAAAPEFPEDLTSQTPVPTEEVVAADTASLQEEPLVTEEDEVRKSSSSSMWLPFLILGILVVVVVWLVIFASNSMKKQNLEIARHKRHEKEDDDDENDEETYQAERRRPLPLSAPVISTEISDRQVAMQTELDTLRRENESLKIRLQSQQTEITALQSQLSRALAEKEAMLKNAENAAPHNQYANPRPQVIFLGRVNSKGVFVRADRNFTPGHSIYRLTTTDGFSGSFRVENNPEAADLALLSPGKTLMNACVGADLNDTEGVEGIATENAGTAIFENGVWRVMRKARISYIR